jgi:hypothetical protein
VAVTADGASVYVGSPLDDAIARFDREPTGKLKYRGCLTAETQSGPAGSGACVLLGSSTSFGLNSGLDEPVAFALSADGASLYIGALADDAIARFERDTTNGKLRYKGCLTGETQSGPAGSAACEAIPSVAAAGINSGLDVPIDAVVSADGASLYVGGRDDTAVAHFARNTTSGRLAYRGCVTGETESGSAGSGACKRIASATSGGASSGLDEPQALALSPDDAFLYVVSPQDDAVARFTREP